jgi:drug/metabolite transporter (DMT)-like permease
MLSISGLIITFIAVLTWAISSVGYKAALGAEGIEDRNPITALAVRVLIVFFLLMPVTMIFGDLTGLFNIPKHELHIYFFWTIIGGILTFIGDITYFYALRLIDSSRAYPLINVQTLFTFPFAYWWLGEAIPPLMYVAAGCMIIGVFFMQTSDAKDRGMETVQGDSRKKRYILGILCALATALFFATQYLAMAMQIRVYPGIFESNFTRIGIYVAIFGIFLLFRPNYLPKWNRNGEHSQLKAYIYTGLFGFLSFGIGDAIYQIGVTANGAALSIIIAATSPLLNQIFAIKVLKEKFRPTFLIAVVLIMLGNILVIF